MWPVAVISDSIALTYTSSNIPLDPGPSSSDLTTKENFHRSILPSSGLLHSASRTSKPKPSVCGYLFLLALALFRFHILARLWGRRTYGIGTLQPRRAGAGWRQCLNNRGSSVGMAQACCLQNCRHAGLWAPALGIHPLIQLCRDTNLILHTQSWQKSADPISISLPKQAGYGIAKRLVPGESLEEAIATQWLQSRPVR